MTKQSITSAGFVFLLAACTSSAPDDKQGTTGGTGGTGTGKAGSGTGGSLSTGGGAGAPVSGSGGASPTGGSAGSTAAGGAAGGSATGGLAGAGLGGMSTGGVSGVAGDAGGGPSGGMAGGAGLGGTSAGGMSGGAGTGSGGDPGTGPVTVNLDRTEQVIQGFGLNTALGGGSVPWDTFYGTGANSLGLSIVRVAMNSSGNLSGTLPPSSAGAKVIGSAWTPSGDCKDNGKTTMGGHLKASCVDSWAKKIGDFAKAQKLYAMAAANEPDFASCGMSIGPPCNGDYDSAVYTANEMVTFVRALGKEFKGSGIKLIAPEPSEWIHLWSNVSATGSTVSGHPNSSDPLKCGCFGKTPTATGCSANCEMGNGYDYGHWLFKDAEAWAAIDIIGTHEYDTQEAIPWPADVSRR